MKPLSSEDYFVIPTKTALKIYNISDLSLKHTLEVKCTAYTLTNDFIIYSEKGNLYYTSLLEEPFSIEEIETFTSKITFISLTNKILSLCTETGESLVYLFNYPEKKEITTITHIAPIRKVYSNGNTTFINDFRNKLKLFPTKKEYDNVENIFYHKYLFTIEKRNLFCLNQSAFAVFLQCKEEIKDVLFSKNGSVLFIQSPKNIFIYDFNKEKLLKKISLEVKEDFDELIEERQIFKRKNMVDSSELSDEPENFYESFIFDEKNNSIILIKESEFKLIKEATTALGEKILSQKMKDVIFEKANYEENFVFLEEKESTFKNKKSKKPNVILKTEFVEPNRKDFSFANENISNLKINNETTIKLENMFLEDSFEHEVISQSVKSFKIKEEIKPKLKIVSKNDRLSLLDYNLYGYLTSLLGEEACFVNLICHDKEVGVYKIIDRNLCKIGSSNDGKIVLANGSENKNKFYFYSPEFCFENELEDEILYVSLAENFISLATKNNLSVFSFSNEEICSFYFKEITFLKSKKDFIFVGENNKLNVINLQNEFESKVYFLANEFDWLDYWDNKIFYSSRKNGNEIIFQFKNGLSEKVCELKSVPLIIKDDHVISLSKLESEPFIEYNIMNYKKNKIPEFKEVKKITEEEKEPEFKREIFFKSKRFSPFKK